MPAAVVWAKALGGSGFNLHGCVSVCADPHTLTAGLWIVDPRPRGSSSCGVGVPGMRMGSAGLIPQWTPLGRASFPSCPEHRRAGLALPRSHPASEKLSNESRSAKSDSPLAKGCNLLLAGLKKNNKKKRIK